MSSSETPSEEKSSLTSSAASSSMSGSPSSAPLKISWRSSVLNQLHARRRREIDPFSDLIILFNRTVEKTGAILMESGQYSFMNEKLRVENEALRAKLAMGQGLNSTQVSVENSSERVSYLEKKLFALQEELTDLHRKRSENAQQIIDQSTLFKENEIKLAETIDDLRLCRAQLKEAHLQISFLQSTISELKVTNQLLTDEYQALQLTLSSSEQKLVEAQRENETYLAKLLVLNEELVKKVNAENERLHQRESQIVQQQLEEAARENKRPVSMDKGAPAYSVGVDSLESAICYSARVPTRAYMNFEAHDGEVNAIKWSPHGLNLATGGADRKVKIWDISKGVAELRATLTGCNSSIMSLDFDASGSFLLAASSGDFTSRVWSLDDHRLRHTLTGHSGKVFSAKFMGDNNKVVSASHDRTLKIWDLRSKSCSCTKFAGSICHDLVCTDSNIISGHFDKKVRFWDSRVSCNDPLTEIELNGKVTSLDLARNGHQLLVATRDDTLRLLDLRTSREVSYFAAPNFRIGCDWTRAVFSPDSEYVCVGSLDGTVLIWKTNEPSRVERVLEAHGSTVYAVAWQPAGNCLTTCDKNKKWFDPGETNYDDIELNVLKYQADYEYASENFSKSKAIYEVIFERSSGMSHVRDACEAITRCSLKLENFEEAFKWANKLHSTSRLNNQDHLSVSLNLLAEVHSYLREYDQESRYLAALIEFHSSLSNLWIRFGKAILNMKTNTFLLLANAALQRGLILLKSVERTVNGFVKDSNLKSQGEVQILIDMIPTSIEEKHHISSNVVSLMKLEIDEERQVRDDFEDLGRSERLKDIEKGFLTLDANPNAENTFTLLTLDDFQKKWFSFLNDK